MTDFFYYFYNSKVETSDIEIFRDDWQLLTPEEITNYKTNLYVVKYENSKYSLELPKTINEIYSIDINEYKISKINELSQKSFTVAEKLLPSYKYSNAQLSKYLVEQGEEPIYNNYLDIIHNYATMVKSLRIEFYRCKYLIENALTIEDIDKITFDYEEGL